jgi:hypothetical protein
VTTFRTVRAAKDYLASQIIGEAEREGIQLSEIEWKMLYFSETDWTLPDMQEVSAEFDRDYDQDEYEQKIGGLIRGFKAGDEARRQQEIEDWDIAVEMISGEDHYLLVLIDAASVGGAVRAQLGRLEPWLPVLDGPSERPSGDLKRLILVSLGLTIALLAAMLITAFFR